MNERAAEPKKACLGRTFKRGSLAIPPTRLQYRCWIRPSSKLNSTGDSLPAVEASRNATVGRRTSQRQLGTRGRGDVGTWQQPQALHNKLGFFFLNNHGQPHDSFPDLGKGDVWKHAHTSTKCIFSGNQHPWRHSGCPWYERNACRHPAESWYQNDCTKSRSLVRFSPLFLCKVMLARLLSAQHQCSLQRVGGLILGEFLSGPRVWGGGGPARDRRWISRV